MYNPTCFVHQNKIMCKFNIFVICHKVYNNFILMQILYVEYTDWVVVFLLSVFLNYNEKTINLILINMSKKR